MNDKIQQHAQQHLVHCEDLLAGHQAIGLYDEFLQNVYRVDLQDIGQQQH